MAESFEHLTHRLQKLAQTLLAHGPNKIEVTPRRVRIRFRQTFIVDTTSARHVWEHPYYPQFYLPVDSFKKGSLVRDDRTMMSFGPSDGGGNGTGDGAWFGSVKADGGDYGGVVGFEGERAKKWGLDGLVRVDFGGVDAWYEEDQQIEVHPKDPYKRVDILPSTRHIRVQIDGQTIAESSACRFLFETGLPVRYYMPQTSVRISIIPESLRLSITETWAKGYYTVRVGSKDYRDVIWYYRYPTQESLQVAGYVCFYNEKVDIFIDGVKEQQPRSKFG
ncbi:MAG: hypothetical protein M1819_006519 [Sarea resinae]|nr:MAG: hypothetical protein M1819_000611 [Sarea resinae]KAI9828812.1 MAG: hypothetical protein M1819_006519 [Sarea resinae]